MEDNQLLMIVLAFILGYMASGMMKNMCGCRLLEGEKKTTTTINPSTINTSCTPKYKAKGIDAIHNGTNLSFANILMDDIEEQCNNICENELIGSQADFCEPIPN